MMLNSIIALKTGERSAFDTAYKKYHAQLYSFINYKTQSSFIAEEVVQLTFIRLWQQREKLDEKLGLDVQLFGMARQVMIDELRKEATRFKYNERYEQSPFTDNLIRMIESNDLLKHFDRELQELPPVRKMVFDMSRKQGLSHKEIAELLSISPKTVENHIGKVLSRLRQYMYTILL